MKDHYSDVLDQFTDSPRVSITWLADAKVLNVQKGEVTVKLTVSNDVPEWFI